MPRHRDRLPDVGSQPPQWTGLLNRRDLLRLGCMLYDRQHRPLPVLPHGEAIARVLGQAITAATQARR